MIIEKDWIVGFVDGEGCFHVSLNKNKSMNLQIQVLPEFIVVQHKRDIKVLHSIKEFFKCGVVRRNHGDRFCYHVRNLKHLTEIIIPFFDKNSLKTVKKYNFLRFRWIVLSMINRRYHLTSEGLEKIRQVKNRMNRAL